MDIADITTNYKVIKIHFSAVRYVLLQNVRQTLYILMSIVVPSGVDGHSLLDIFFGVQKSQSFE